ncbi:MAG TPA: hypothetical protein VJC04_02630 [Candidatus Paceibacterota bacterium]
MGKNKLPFSKSNWKRINSRRLDLVNKKCGKVSLTDEEAHELMALQKQAEDYLNVIELPSVRKALASFANLKRELKRKYRNLLDKTRKK